MYTHLDSILEVLQSVVQFDVQATLIGVGWLQYCITVLTVLQ